MTPPPHSQIVVMISANVEWRAIRSLFAGVELQTSPFGEWFVTDLQNGKSSRSVVLFHGGWGKIAAAASAQYVIDRCQPSMIVNLGTCGGFEGEIERGTVILVDRVIVYDILEQMGDHDEHIAHYTTVIDLTWLKEPYPHDVLRTLLVSGDRDLVPAEIPVLKATYGAVAGDWESGSIAWVAARNQTKCLILRGVTDLVGQTTGDAYDGNIHVFEENTLAVMTKLVRHLPAWIEQVQMPATSAT